MTDTVYSYFESRAGAKWADTVFFGLQYILKSKLEGHLFDECQLDEDHQLLDAHLGKGFFNRAGWDHILRDHNGSLPLRIYAVPEGSVVSSGNVLMTVENTCPQCFWLTSYLETLLVQVWYPSTVCTLSREVKKVILRYLEWTGDPAQIGFKLHDFGCRGSTSMESAGIGGVAHLVNFLGTDTIPALEVARDYYDAGVCGFSIPAAEHSTITSWGCEGETDAYDNMLDKYPNGLMACVSDSYDIMKACDIWGTTLKAKVLARNGVFICRPDSGKPEVIVPQVIERLGYHFGFTVNEKGYKVLHPKVRVIQGDGCTPATIEAILAAMEARKLSADNVAFGMGGGLLQQVNRDTQRFAFKCSAIRVNGEWRDVYKSPVTDMSKSSKRGRLKLIKSNGNYVTVGEDAEGENLLKLVFENGVVFNTSTMQEIRERAKL